MKRIFFVFFSLSTLYSFAQIKTEKVSATSQATINFNELAIKAALTSEIIQIPDLSNKMSKTIPLPREVPAGRSIIEYKGPTYQPQPMLLMLFHPHLL